MKRLLIDHRPDGIYTALTENGKLTELFIDPVSQNTAAEGSWVGRVIVGRIKTILPGQFAFVNIGGKKNAFINLLKEHGLKAGQPVLVQVQKDAVGTKGMYVALEISLKGRLVVLAQGSTQTVGVSRKIEDEPESRRLRKIARKHLPPGYAIIVRTNAVGQTQEAIAEEIEALHKIHADIITRAEFARPPATLYPSSQSATVSQSLLSDILSDELEGILISTEKDDTFAALKNSICQLLPCLESKILRKNINLKKQIKAALEKEVRLLCGGFITIEQTEACVVIDVNTGSNVGKINYSETVFETNLEAAVEIAAQIRLRNLAGIIIVDFIDMQQAADKAALLNTFTAELKKDRITLELEGFVGLGMVLLTRRKTRPPISALLETTCPLCGGKGRVSLPE